MTPGPYTLQIQVASAKAGGRFHIEFDGEDVTGPIAVPDTGAWTKLETIRVDRVHVPAGKAMMKAVSDADGESMSIGDIDCFGFFRPRDSPTAPRTP